ncbi:hypothetical protein HV819_06065 [Anaerococcus sp. AGMB00486]|uniref:Transcriptional regulator n=1 Tax=Anaerococcus faecalis TaxID=2742993 RepID=A0ABX2NA63_9FIRM|nr:hypothetical protein [Anaerococcus faecalis]NVF11548.1 hypothetical protein [Anaerococcus faecalis]
MDYIYKIYYQDRNKYKDVYKNRVSNELAFLTDLSILHKNHAKSNVYFLPNINTWNKLEKIRENDNILINIKNELPSHVHESLIIDAISSELQRLLLIGFIPNAIYLYNLEITRNEIIDILKKERYPVSRIKKGLDKLVNLGYISVVRKRPLSYIYNYD